MQISLKETNHALTTGADQSVRAGQNFAQISIYIRRSLLGAAFALPPLRSKNWDEVMKQNVAASKQFGDDMARSGICVMPWVNLHVSTNGSLAPCCSFQGSIGNLSGMTMEEAWNSAKLAEIRRQFFDGEKVKERWKCIDREVHEGSSMRTEKNANFGDWYERLQQNSSIDEVVPPHPVALDLRFSNLCNFKCRSCWHGASSKWFTDSKAMGLEVGPNAEIRSFRSLSDAVSQVSAGFAYLEEIYFAGGEPLIQAEHYAMLKLLIERERTDVRLSYNTNLSLMQLGGVSVFDLWQRFSTLKVEASVDGAYERGEFLRSGFKWATFVDNVRELKKNCPQVDLSFGITVSSLNILTLPDLLRTLHQECEAKPGQFHLHSLQSPEHYGTQSLPKALKRQAAAGIEAYLVELRASDRHDPAVQKLQSKLRGLISYMNAKDLTHTIPRMKQITKGLDALRSEEIEVTLPELKPLIDYLTWWRKNLFAVKRLTRRIVNRARRYKSLPMRR